MATGPFSRPLSRMTEAAKAKRFGIRSLARSEIKSSGRKAGEGAPEFRLPRLDGGELSLEELRGRRVLLVFSDPQKNQKARQHYATELLFYAAFGPSASPRAQSRWKVKELPCTRKTVR